MGVRPIVQKKESGLLPHLSRSCVSPLADAAVAHTHWRRSDPPYGIRWKAVSGADPPDGTWQVGRVELTPLLDHGMQKSLGSEPKGDTPQSDSHIRIHPNNAQLNIRPKYVYIYFFLLLGGALACHTIHRTVQVCVHTSTHVTALHTFISQQSCAHVTLEQ